jgi:hypothetical protein
MLNRRYIKAVLRSTPALNHARFGRCPDKSIHAGIKGA